MSGNNGENGAGQHEGQQNGNLNTGQNGQPMQFLAPKMSDAKISASPMMDMIEITDEQKQDNTKAPYRQAIGCLMYLANCSRPDIIFAVNLLSRYNQDPKECHWEAVKRIFRYLKETKDYCIVYKQGADKLVAFSDSDHAGDQRDRHSTSGVMIKYGNGPIVFTSKKQTAVAQSSTESEYIAANEAVKEIV